MTAQTPDPPGGQIYKDENGELLGKVAENAARLFSAITPSGSTREQRRAGVKLISEMMNSSGTDVSARTRAAAPIRRRLTRMPITRAS